MFGKGAGGSIGKWGRYVRSDDAYATLIVDQYGSGNILELRDSGVAVLTVADGGAVTFAGSITIADDTHLHFGTDGDEVFLNSSGAISADAEVTGVIVGTSIHPATATNSLIISNVTTDGDILILASDGGNSKAFIFFDASTPDLYLYNVGGTWTGGATAWTIPAVTLGGAITGNSQSVTGVGTFGAGAATVTGLTITSEVIQTAGAWAFQKAYNITTTAGALTLAPTTVVSVTATALGGLTIGGVMSCVNDAVSLLNIGTYDTPFANTTQPTDNTFGTTVNISHATNGSVAVWLAANYVKISAITNAQANNSFVTTMVRMDIQQAIAAAYGIQSHVKFTAGTAQDVSSEVIGISAQIYGTASAGTGLHWGVKSDLRTVNTPTARGASAAFFGVTTVSAGGIAYLENLSGATVQDALYIHNVGTMTNGIYIKNDSTMTNGIYLSGTVTYDISADHDIAFGTNVILDGIDAASGAGNVADAPTLSLGAHYRDGSNVNTNWTFTAYHDMTAGGAAPVSHVDLRINSVDILTLTNTNGTPLVTPAGNINMAGNRLVGVGNYIDLYGGTGQINIYATYSLRLFVPENDADAFYISDGSTLLMAIDSRSTVTVENVKFISPASQSLPDGATSRMRAISQANFTITLAGTTQITTLNQGISLCLGAPTINQSGGAVTVDQASTLHIPVITAGTSVTITANRMISTGVADCFLTSTGVWTDTASTLKVKRDIREFNLAETVPYLIDQLQPKMFRYNGHFNNDFGRQRYGLIAEEFPDFLRVPGEESRSAINASVMANFALVGVKYAKAEIDALKDKVSSLEKELAGLKN